MMALTTEEMEKCVKVVVVGNGGVGKSSMVRQYTAGKYTENYKKTIGVEFLEKDITVPSFNNEDVKIMLWDTAGQEEFDQITSGYYKDAAACVLVFSTTDRASFENVRSWSQKIDKVCPNILKVLVQNKVDLRAEAQVSNQEVEGLALELKLKLYRASVKENMNINELFEGIAEEYLSRLRVQARDSALPAVKASQKSPPVFASSAPALSASQPVQAAAAPARPLSTSSSRQAKPDNAVGATTGRAEGTGGGGKKDCIIS